ncbi:transcription termination/antitermination protein NusG [Bradyrhizobium sp. CCBAU 11386]|uniref:transcription termination/antitermination protein NusG n=1 Tax=Bradyrhizobium sp. CCBAU 11386 TaxID=1630837 RepID=UPI0023024AE8|nr:transcription termination/antitermination NusG family protein [Bradyrhizobium sp. CCBAU 11386]
MVKRGGGMRMNQTLRPREFVRGEIVGSVDLEQLRGPLEVPVEPERWYILRVHPHLQLNVMRTFRQRNISAWLPMQTETRSVSRYNRGYEKILTQQVRSPLICGAILVPDFEVQFGRFYAVDGVIDVMRVGPCVPVLKGQDVVDLRNIEAIGNTPKSKRERKFELGQLVRVTSGPFAHFCGQVERFDSGGRLSVGLQIFGRLTPISVEESDLELAQRPRSRHSSSGGRQSLRRIPSR